MIDPDEAVTAKRALKEYGIVPDIVFIRNDGFTLGAPTHLEHAAYSLWKGQWTHFLRRPVITPLPMEEYVEILPMDDTSGQEKSR